MSFNTDQLLQQLSNLQGAHPPARYLVLWSGGLDSTVLLHALWQGRNLHRTSIVAVHINHALQDAAAAWEDHCRRFAASLDMPFVSCNVAVAHKGGGLEAAAREARYAAIREIMHDNDHVLSAHHEQDQAETLMLNLLRGSGPAGLAGIAAIQPYGAGLLVRPMLGVPREDIEAYAAEHGLSWIEDPSNDDVRFDRNYLRREILPRLRLRWPAATARLRRSAELLAEAAELQTNLAELDLATAGDDPSRLAISALGRLSPMRQRNLLRHAIRCSGLPPPPSTRLYQAVDELIPARADANPLVRWPGGELRRYRDSLYILPEAAADELHGSLTLRADGSETCLGPTLGSLMLEGNNAGGIDPRLVGCGLSVRFREGGEAIRASGRVHRRLLKKLLQETAVVPWMRQRIPLLYAEGALVAVGDLWIAEEASCPSGYAVRWKNRPPLF